MMNFNVAFFANGSYLYYQLIAACVLLLLVFFFSSFSESVVIEYGCYLFVGCMIISFLISFFMENYWRFMLHWFLLSIAYFVFWCVLNFICGRWGKPYNGDGGMILLLPGYFLPLLIFISVIVKVVKIVFGKF